MNKEQQELLDEVYEKYCKESKYKFLISKEAFTNTIKINHDFAKEWGLKIDERELSESERVQIYYKKHNKGRVGNKITKFILNNDNIPTKLITITYNNERIESKLEL
jgi:hypothetical protein